MVDTMMGHAQTAGESVPCLEVLAGNQRGRVFVLDRVGAYVIGRLPGTEVCITDHGVSRRHVRLTRRGDGSIEAADMRSTNGLYVNGQRRERTLLCEGDQLSLGPDASLRLRWLTASERAAEAKSAHARATRGGPDERPGVPTVVENDQTIRAQIALLGLGEDRPAPADTSEDTQADQSLSARQLEVGRLVARGLTNAAIGEQLGISTRTVTTHLDHIYSRLGIGSRTVLTRWLRERGLAEPGDDAGLESSEKTSGLASDSTSNLTDDDI
jgi:DNA-binding CsgD family transcriptional regulator